MAIAAGADAVGLVSRMPSGAIIAQLRRCRANTIQLVDEVEAGARAELRESLPGISIVQVIHVRDEGAIRQAVLAAPEVDAILLDSGNPSLSVKELGGTGRAHDWKISRAIRDAVPVPVYLAGGLNAANVAVAIALVVPFGIDVCSGVRTAGSLDEIKLAGFMKAVHGASFTGTGLALAPL